MLNNISKLGNVLNKRDQKLINGGVFTFCKNLGDTGQACSSDSDCSGQGSPVCFRGCCNTIV